MSSPSSRVWVLFQQYQPCDLSCTLIGIFSTEEQLDAFAAAHDPSIKGFVGYIHREDDFFFTFYRKKSMPVDALADNIDRAGTPIYGAKYEELKAVWREEREARRAERHAARR
jgi:hypothetical protein